MSSVRRWYIYLVSAISLQGVVWAFIELLRNFFVRSGALQITSIALEIAAILIGLPVFVVHWLWAQRLAKADTDEREAGVRSLYLYANLAIFMTAFVYFAFNLVKWLPVVIGSPAYRPSYQSYSAGQELTRCLLALVPLGLVWLFHWWIAVAETRTATELSSAHTLRRFYILLFSAVGLCMVSLAVINLLRWVMYLPHFFSPWIPLQSNGVIFVDELARLLVGLPLWLIFWRWAQRLYASADQAEKESVLRKLYLYLAVLVAVITAIINATLILANILRRLFALPSSGDLRDQLPTLIVMALVWIYHAMVLRKDAASAGEAPRQSGVRRLYFYLVAAVGLAALLGGLAGDISVVIRLAGKIVFNTGLKEQVATFSSMLIAGLPVWLIPWRQMQRGAWIGDAPGAAERRSLVRKIYLYFYLFLATMTMLGSLIYIAYRLISTLLGAPVQDNMMTNLGLAIAYALIALGVWLYHGRALRRDSRLGKTEQADSPATVKVAILDGGDGRLGRGILDGLLREMPGLQPTVLGLTEEAAILMGQNGETTELTAQLSEFNLIVGPASIAIPETIDGGLPSQLATAVSASKARKLLIPQKSEGCEWIGLENLSTETLIRQTVRAVGQALRGEEIKPARPLSPGAIIAIVIGPFIFLYVLLIIVSNYLITSSLH